jgi:hypothetical protein
LGGVAVLRGSVGCRGAGAAAAACHRMSGLRRGET